MPGPTIAEVLASTAYPDALKEIAKTLYETKLIYTGKAATAVHQVVTNAEALTIDDNELKAVFSKIVDIRAAAVKACDEAFAVISADFPPPAPPAPPPPPPPPPAPVPVPEPTTIPGEG